MIYLVWAPPSQGKTYVITSKMVKKLLEGKRKIYSNYPIVIEKPLTKVERLKNIYRWIRKQDRIKPQVLSTLKWEEEYVYAGITDADIVFDEAYMFKGFSSRDKMDKDTQSFFATNGHDGNDFYLIAQHYNRLELILREMASFYVYISKISNPLSIIGSGGRSGELKPLLFIVEYYLSEEEFKFRRIKNTVWKTEYIRFKDNVANAYDTKYFRKTEKPLKPVKWSELMNKKEDKEFEEGLKLITT